MASSVQLSPPETWVDSYADYLYSYALYRVSDSDIAEELVQETFVAALAARSSFKGNATEKTWITSILKKKILDFYRKRYRDRTDTVEDVEALPVDQFFDDGGHWAVPPQRWDENPEQKFEETEFLRILTKCLETINPKQADAFRLKEINQADTEVICKILNISPTNYWVLIHRARLFMRRCLELRWFNTERERP